MQSLPSYKTQYLKGSLQKQGIIEILTALGKQCVMDYKMMDAEEIQTQIYIFDI